jgi:hypothetical protein
MRNARTVQCLFIMNVDTRENCYLSKQELLVKIYTLVKVLEDATRYSWLIHGAVSYMPT